ncbi:MAG: [Fe-Fe] hydrogenase large subunit C-terminal domain-containing protein [Bacteroidota bacterium]|nr:[Fe-Fe] hydrogenase large subunit C-terminal domain-containing protein [Bacteroidota bacterium]
MEKGFFHHALTIREDICNGCSLCMRVCPTEALRIRDGKARLIEDRCVDCGECFRSCPVHAIIIEQDDFSRIFDYKHRVALVPAVLHGQFRHEVSMSEISAVLKSLGFTWVYEVEHGAEILKPAIDDLMNVRTLPRPLISSYCPAVVRLIQVRFPALIRNLATVKAPLEMAAFYCRRVLRDRGAHNAEIGVFYVTPCAAKIAAVKSPVGEESTPISGVINMDFIYNKINRTLRNKGELPHGDDHAYSVDPDTLVWSLTNGEASCVNGRTLAIDGMSNVTEFLEQLENDEITGVDYLELRACDEGCAGGVLLSSNRFLVAERLRNKARNLKPDTSPGSGDDFPDIEAYSEYLMNKVRITDEIRPRSMYRLSGDRDEAMRMMKRSRRLMCWLPGTDCGLCGAPSCQALAEDIVRHRGDISQCVFIRESNLEKELMDRERSAGIMRRIWGDNNFTKNCNKKGAENESN